MSTANNVATSSLSRKRVWRWYLVLSIIYSSVTILTGIIFIFPQAFLPFTLIWGPVVLAWFLFEMVMLILMLTKKIEKVALWLPSLTVFDFIFSSVLGFVVGITLGPTGLQNPIVNISSLVFPIIILIVAIKLVSRK